VLRSAPTPTEAESLAELLATLDALRRSDDPFAPSHERHWRWLLGWVRARSRGFAGSGPREDVEQETLVAIARHVRHMEADTPLGAAKWVSTILRRKHVDALREKAVDPVTRGLASSPEESPLDELAAEEPLPAAHAVLEDRYDRMERALLEFVEQSEPNVLTRVTRRAQARAAFYRLVLDLDAEGVDSRLRMAEPVGKDRLYKWVERGRPLVAAAMRAWAERHPSDEEIAALAKVAIELVEERRADAGKPRPSRRRS
jgi:DNA-directed RNA polymerase specialized sigma24 family protein